MNTKRLFDLSTKKIYHKIYNGKFGHENLTASEENEMQALQKEYDQELAEGYIYMRDSSPYQIVKDHCSEKLDEIESNNQA